MPEGLDMAESSDDEEARGHAEKTRLTMEGGEWRNAEIDASAPHCAETPPGAEARRVHARARCAGGCARVAGADSQGSAGGAVPLLSDDSTHAFSLSAGDLPFLRSRRALTLAMSVLHASDRDAGACPEPRQQGLHLEG